MTNSKFIDKYLETMSATQSACVGYRVKSRNVAGVIDHENLKKPNIMIDIENILNLSGLSSDAIASSIQKNINLNAFRGIKQALRLHGYKV